MSYKNSSPFYNFSRHSIIFVLLITSTMTTNETVKYASIYQNSEGKLIIEDGKYDPKSYIASAKYTVGMETIGWDLLAISTNRNFGDEIQAEAAGRLEGYLTAPRIWNHWRNMNAKADWKNSTYMPESIQSYFKDQENYIENLYQNNKTDDFSANAYLLLLQFRGLINAYNEIATNLNQTIEPVQFHTMASFGDLFDIIYYNNTSALPRFNTMSNPEILSFIRSKSHCSVIFKMKEDFSDLFFGHNSWFDYSTMSRIFKEYNFNFNHPSVKSRNIIFSSYPATISSIDDFYITSQDLVVIETTNVNFNNDLYKLLSPQTLLCWQRAMIANRISSNTTEWVQAFAKMNSGTYNNMFMVLDMKLVDVDNKSIKNGALQIIEQLPGYTEVNDVTNYLKYGYWPSYNTPFSKNIVQLSNIKEILESKPELSSEIDYNSCARANIFRRDQGNVQSLDDLKFLMRFNNYKSDPLSLGNPGLSIACRGDLANSCEGAIDAKLSSVKLSKGQNKTISIIQGPTNQNLTAFNWKTSSICSKDPHFGLTEEYNFDWYDYKNQFYDESIYGQELKYLTPFN